ncbi:trypsin-like peptidase domain-containing protein [Roseomonas sp. PWR1]|uniref:Trypsin-like peptidase domain-containing protein n=1 Tax=Roseomonas nitratireducens TaxID=2820810 RepID=A0ABS4AUN5_9PROT|nr:trypsin-like peptidase domain-containing protein [Neoroseomonas nitratireducens]MBP0465070.1 trypsin-like peptidase domain-containing protein [Neoroseomonas nitratireducens]
MAQGIALPRVAGALLLLLAGCAGAPRGQDFAGCLDAATPEVAASVLRISVQPRGAGPVTRGTGFVLAGSAVEPGAPNRVVTAAHVVARALEGPSEVDILLARADGTMLATARVAATARPWNPLDALDPARADQAVLEVTGFADPAAQRAFAAAPGLTPAPDQPAGALLDIRVDGSRGIEPGASGAPILGPDGRVHGILVHRRIEEWTRSASDSLSDHRRARDGMAAAAQPVRGGIAQPLAAPAIMTETRGAPPADAPLDILAPAFPRRDCTLYRGRATYRSVAAG